MITLVLVTTGAGLLVGVLAWLARDGSPLQLVAGTVMVAALVLDGIVVLTGDGVGGWGEGPSDGLLLLAGGLAVAGGGPLTTSVLWLVDRRQPEEAVHPAGR